MKNKRIIPVLLLIVLLLGNWFTIVHNVYGSSEEIVQNESSEELLTETVRVSVSIKNEEEELQPGNKATLLVKMSNKTEEKRRFRLYFCDGENPMPQEKEQWSSCFTRAAQSVKIDGMSSENKMPIMIKFPEEEKEEALLEVYQKIENEKMVTSYAQLEIPPEGATEFELVVSSEKEEKAVIIPTVEDQEIVYGEPVYIEWKAEEVYTEEIIEENTEMPENFSKEEQKAEGETVEENLELEIDGEVSLNSESHKFRTVIPQKGGVLNLLYDFEEAQWTTVYPKRKGLATTDTLSGGTVIKAILAADPGYCIASCRVLEEDLSKWKEVEGCIGKERFELEIEILREDITLEVMFEKKRELTVEEEIYQNALEFIYNRDDCAEVKEETENKNKVQMQTLEDIENRIVEMPDQVYLEVGDRISYPSQTYISHEFNISGCNGIVGPGYCMHPNKKNPPSGWYSDIRLLDETRPDYANAYKLIMLTNYGMELQPWGDFWFGISDRGQKKYREIYIHAIIGYLETGTLIGLSGEEQTGVINIANDVYKRANNGEVGGILKKYRVYEIYTENANMQNICFMTQNSKGGISIQKKSNKPEITDYNEHYSLQGAVYGIYSDENCTKQIMTMTTDETGYAATADDALEDGKYYVKEQTPSKGYLLDTSIYRYDIAGGGKAEENKKISSEPPKMGRIDITKTSVLPEISDNNQCYDLGGAEYTIYKNQDCTEYVSRIITDSAGNGTGDSLPLGTYYVKETKAPKGYEQNQTVYTAVLRESEKAVTIEGLKVQDYPENYVMGIHITKKGRGKETVEVPTLEGTQFTVKYYDGYFNKDNLPDMAERIWVVEVKKNKGTGKYVTGLTQEYLVNHLSDKLYKNEKDEAIIPYGTITIQETKPASGYTLKGTLKDKNGKVVAVDSELYVAQVKKERGNVMLEGGNEFTAEDELIHGSIKIKKYQADGKMPLEGAEFEIKNGEGEILQVKTTDKNGEIMFDQLYPDRYTITETKTVEGNTLLKEPLVVQIPGKVTAQEIKENNIDESKCIYDPIEDVYYIYHYAYDITNHANFQIPMTGGRSGYEQFLFLVAGMILFAGAIVILMKKNYSVSGK